MSQIAVQDVWSSRTSSDNLENYRLLRPNRNCIVQGRVCGCVEGATLRSGRCCKGHKDVLERRLAEGGWRELPLILSSCVPAYRRGLVEVLQGGCDMENAPASECPATDRSGDVRDSVRNDIRLDGQWKHQRFREGTPRCKSVGAGMLLTQSLASVH